MLKKSRELLLSLAGALLALSTQAAQTPLYDMPQKADFVKSLGAQNQTETTFGAKDMHAVQQVFDEKLAQHTMSRHNEKGMSCVSCHDPKSISKTDWMLRITKPVMRKVCQDCHTVQKEVFAHADTHSKVDCIACHMPNVPAVDGYADALKGTDKFAAVRRAHFYKINTDPNAEMVVSNAEGNTVWAKDKEGHGYVNLFWSCDRPAPADYTLCEEGKGCHSPATSKLDRGLIYQSQREVADEVEKIQRPIKDGYDRITKTIERQKKLLEVTRLTPADQTEVRLLIDKAADIAQLIRADGSWGMHASRYLKDRVQTAESFLTKAQMLIDNGGYKNAAK